MEAWTFGQINERTTSACTGWKIAAGEANSYTANVPEVGSYTENDIVNKLARNSKKKGRMRL